MILLQDPGVLLDKIIKWLDHPMNREPTLPMPRCIVPGKTAPKFRKTCRLWARHFSESEDYARPQGKSNDLRPPLDDGSLRWGVDWSHLRRMVY